MRGSFQQAIDELELLSILSEFDPMVIGTPPLRIDVPGSDIDVACYCPDLSRFQRKVTGCFAQQDGFQIQKLTMQGEVSVVIRFHAHGWDFELFCQSVPTCRQWGVRHFQMERRLLSLAPKLREMVVAKKQRGLKTEPAFAEILQLPGDPYVALLDLESQSDTQLEALIRGGLQH